MVESTHKIEQVAAEIGKILKGGEFIETPFDQPFEEESHGDPDQRDDDANFFDSNFAKNIEAVDKKDIRNIVFDEKIRFFLDGSLRTKFLGEYVDRDQSFPILAAEVACAVMKKSEKKLDPASVNWRLVFIFPHKGTGLLADTQYSKLKNLSEGLERSKSPFRIEFLEKSDARDVRYSMQGKARDVMHNLEHETANSLTRNEGDWLIMDGAIRKAEFLTLNNTIGVAKSFSRKPHFQIGTTTLNITRYLSGIKEGERSAIFKKDSAPEVAFWYLRIRTFPPMEPLGGFVKIDFKFEDTSLSENDVNIIDQLSSEIYSMRSPSFNMWPYNPNISSFRNVLCIVSSATLIGYRNDGHLGYG